MGSVFFLGGGREFWWLAFVVFLFLPGSLDVCVSDPKIGHRTWTRLPMGQKPGSR